MWMDNPWYAQRVEELPIEFVQQFIGNSLRKSEKQIMELQQDIFCNGFLHPVTLVVSRFDKRVYLGEGNHRLEIAKRLGLRTIPTMVGLYKYAEKPTSGYGSVIYPWLNPIIEDLDFYTNKPSDVFTRYEIVARRVSREKVVYLNHEGI